ncbi:MAG: transcriptional regulator [Muribaculaceae bacterium]|nr:transcriptional regulator [Muribaculaceae bacterium]
MNTPESRHTHEACNRAKVRWYVLTLPYCHRGPARGLEEELAWRRSHGEPEFEYFAPLYSDASCGGTKNARRALYFNYVFVHASEAEIMRMKTRRPLFNFLRRVTEADGSTHFPYLADEAMANLRLVAEAYSGRLPAYVPQPGMLRRGDRVRIVGGRFDGVEATLLRTPSSSRDELAVCVDNWMCVPVVHVAPGHYEIIELSAEGKARYSVLDNERTTARLRSALVCSLSRGAADSADVELATETAMRYGRISPPSKVLKCKHAALMLQAYAVAGDRLRLGDTVRSAELLLREVDAEQSRALLLASLYGTTQSHREEALAAVRPWRSEPNLKKNKRMLIEWLDAIENAINN